MKKILYMIALVWMAFCVASCEKEVKDYDGQEGVYFYVQYGAAHGDTTIWASHSSTPVAFANVSGDYYDVKLRVMTTGRIKDYDRTFRVVVDKDSTTAITWLFNDEFYPFHGAVKAIREAADLAGMDKLMWGSDYPRTITAITYKMSYDFILKTDELTEREIGRAHV